MRSHSRFELLTSIAFCFLAVAAGAFGSHGLKKTVSAEILITFEAAVRYQFFHSLAVILVVAILPGGKRSFGTFFRPERLFLAGVLFFSGSLYIYIFTGIRAFAMITPAGGLLFLAGWAMFFREVYINHRG